MFKNCLFFICAVFILEVRSDCDGYVDCFNNFFSNFFANSDSNVEYINTTSKNLPENFVEVKDLDKSELDKVLTEISSFIQQDITDQLKTLSEDVVFTNANPNTKIYVKTFNYNNPDNDLLPVFKNINVNEYTITPDDKKEITVENRSSTPSGTPKATTKRDETTAEDQSTFSPTPQTTTKSAKEKIANQKDVSENEILKDDVVSYYDSTEDNSTDYPIIDYVELYKDTTNEENLYEPTTVNPIGGLDEIQESVAEYVDSMEAFLSNIENGTESLLTDGSPILPWIATIFIKNDTKSNQFEYYCDGALLNEKLLITAARCVNRGNSTVAVEDILVILGKKSLLAMADKEQAVKIKQILTHENFTNENGKTDNDLALLVLEAPAVFNEIIQPATFGNDTDEEEKWSSAFTTAWNLAGAIVPVSLEKKDDKARKDCVGESAAENMICAAYGLDVPLCPSYGGILGVAETETWRLHGIRSGDPEDRGICLNKNIWFTELRPYKDWILEHME